MEGELVSKIRAEHTGYLWFSDITEDTFYQLQDETSRSTRGLHYFYNFDERKLRMFNEFLRTNYLEANADQKVCYNKSYVQPTFEGSKFCHEHFLRWTPADILSGDEIAMAELRKLFEKAASEQWFPETQMLAKVIKEMESDSKARIPASQMVNIDLEFSALSKEVLQIGLADLEGARVLDCLTRCSTGIIASSSSPLSAPASYLRMTGFLMQIGSLGNSEKSVFLRKPFSCLGRRGASTRSHRPNVVGVHPLLRLATQESAVSTGDGSCGGWFASPSITSRLTITSIHGDWNVQRKATIQLHFRLIEGIHLLGYIYSDEESLCYYLLALQ